MGADAARAAVRDRVAALPGAIRDCEGCGGESTMLIRRSSLQEQPCADDVTLKCGDCYHARTHGIPIGRTTFEAAMEQRGRRVLDFVEDGPAESVEENLASLGYIDY